MYTKIYYSTLCFSGHKDLGPLSGGVRIAHLSGFRLNCLVIPFAIALRYQNVKYASRSIFENTYVP